MPLNRANENPTPVAHIMLKYINAVCMLIINASLVCIETGRSPINIVKIAVMMAMAASIPAPRMVAIKLAAIP